MTKQDGLQNGIIITDMNNIIIFGWQRYVVTQEICGYPGDMWLVTQED